MVKYLKGACHKKGKFSSLPVYYEVLRKDEFSGAVERSPDEPDH